ncbi:hypothetical protein ACUNDQ_18475, partial [Pectobacterium brasiliense]|uniref:hypothetical protein n=1 Tax=Pectobacterium brasiliense TaxID=180957 RepID=UPI0040440CD4
MRDDVIIFMLPRSTRPTQGRLYLSHVVISYHYMKQSELPQGAKVINLVIEFKPSVSPFTPALTLNGYLE